MQAKHTQGRWYLQHFTDVYTNIVRCDNGKGFETIYICNLHGEGCNNRANAQLIAAAPDMLESLKYYFDVLKETRGDDWDKKPDHVLQKMISAYKKAIEEIKEEKVF